MSQNNNGRLSDTDCGPYNQYEEYKVSDRYYTFTPTTFTKRQRRPSEYTYRCDGSLAVTRWERERIVNERDALIFIAENTSIPVPRLLEWPDIDGVGSITLERIGGASFNDVHFDLGPEDRAKLERNTLTFIEGTLLPQLRSLRSTKMGQLAGVVVPPVRVSSHDERPSWELRTSTTSRYVYCHNDITVHNILVDPATLTINAVIDWEYSGFFPEEMEFPFWKLGRDASFEEEHCQKMVDLLDAPGEIRFKATIDFLWVLNANVHRRFPRCESTMGFIRALLQDSPIGVLMDQDQIFPYIVRHLLLVRISKHVSHIDEGMDGKKYV